MRPDVFYTYYHAGEGEAALIIEIDSKELEATCRKLAYALMEQALHLRRYDNTILEVAGYYFPSDKRATSVVRVTVTWSDDYLNFSASRTPLPADGVPERIRDREVGGHVVRFTRALCSSSNIQFCA